jgi:hypothetical protein
MGSSCTFLFGFIPTIFPPTCLSISSTKLQIPNSLEYRQVPAQASLSHALMNSRILVLVSLTGLAFAEAGKVKDDSKYIIETIEYNLFMF